MSLPPYVSDDDFLKKAAQLLRAQFPAGMVSEMSPPTLVKGTPAPCADADQHGRDAAGGSTMVIRSRLCYAKPGAAHGWLIFFGELLAAGRTADLDAADAFIAATTPK